MSTVIDPVPYLEESRDAFSALAHSLDDAAARRPLGEDRWSADGFLEHLAAAERGILHRLQKCVDGPAPAAEDLAATAGKAEFLLQHIPTGARKVEAPEFLRPTGRYGDWPGSRDAFLAAREALLTFARETPIETLDRMVMPHQALGPLTGTQWLYFCAAHSERHRLQISAAI